MKVKLDATFLNVKSLIEIPDQDIIELFENISKEIKELSKFSYKEDDKSYTLRNDTADIEKQIILDIRDSNHMACGFGSDYNLNDRIPYYETFYSFVEKFTKVSVFKTNLIEYIGHYFLKFKGDHDELLRRAFFKESIIKDLFNKDSKMFFLENRLLLRGKIDDRRIAIVRFISGTSDEEIIKNEFEERELKFRISVGLTENIRQSGNNLSEIVIDHDKKSTSFIEERAKKYIFDPIENLLV